MKLFIFSILILLWSGILLAGNPIRLENNGYLIASEYRFRISLYNKKWRHILISSRKSQLIQEKIEKNGTGKVKLQFTKLSEIPDGTLSTSLEGKTEQFMTYTANLNFEQAANLKLIALSMTFKHTRFSAWPIIIDGKKITLPPPGKQASAFKYRCSKLNLPYKEGNVEFSGTLDLMLQEFKSHPGTWQLRILFSPSYGKVIKQTGLKFKLRQLPYQGTTINLRSAANMGFSDKIPRDGKGGWTDQGPENDLRQLAVGHRRFGAMDFEIINPKKNRGRSCIVLAGKDSKFSSFPNVASTGTLSDKPTGKFLHLLHAGAYAIKPKVGKITLTYVDNSSQTINIRGFIDIGDWWKPVAGKNSDIVWMWENRSSNIGLYRSGWKIQNKPIKQVDFRAADAGSIWGIVAMTVSEHEPRRVKETPRYIVNGKNWRPFKFLRDIVPGSVMDFSNRLDAPAGKYGPVVIRNGHFEFRDRPGTPVRFYGTNLCGRVCTMNRKWIDRLVERLAADGFNAVRFHHQDSIYNNPERLERFDYFIAALKKRGIYFTTDLYVTYHPFAATIPKVEKRPPKSYIYAREYKGLFYVMDQIFDDYKSRVTQWLTHVNPYTGIAVKDEPALISLSYLNEANPNYYWCETPFSKSLYEKAFQNYCREHGISSKQNEADYEHHFDEFLTSLYLKRYQQIKDFIKKIGVNKPFTDQNFGKSPRLAGMRNLYDYVDNHAYYAHPKYIGPNKTLPLRFNSESALKKTLVAPGAVFATRIYGRPFTISEFDYPKPNRYRAEGVPILSAYSALQGYDAIYHFAYAHSPKRIKKNLPTSGGSSDPFDATSDPIKAISMKIGSALFLATDGVKTAPISFTILQDGIKGLLFKQKYPAKIADLGLIASVGTVIGANFRSAVDRLPQNTVALLNTGYNFPSDYGNDLPVINAQKKDLLAQVQKKGLLKPGCYDSKNQIFRSTNNQISLDRKNECFQVCAPGVEVFILPPGKTGRGKFMKIDNKVGRGVFAAIVHTGSALTDAKRILLLHLTDTQGSKTKFRSAAMIQLESFGVAPFLAERGEAILTLLPESGKFRCYALNSNGKRLSEIAAVKAKNGSTQFLLQTFQSKGVVMGYELTRK